MFYVFSNFASKVKPQKPANYITYLTGNSIYVVRKFKLFKKCEVYKLNNL